jgi:hypothetical protein
LDKFYGDLPTHIKREFIPILITYRSAIEEQIKNEIGDLKFTTELDDFVDNYLSTYSDRYVRDSVNQLRRLVAESEPEDWEDVLNRRLDEWDEKRPEKVAERESSQFLNGLGSMLILAGGFSLVWTAQGKSCPYCIELNGRKIRSGQAFVDKGDFQPEGAETPFFVRSMRKHPPLHRGCDCMALPA